LASFTIFLKDRIGYILFAAGILYFLFLIRGDVIQNSKLSSDKKALAGNLALELTLKESLKTRYNSLNSGGYVEQVARDKLEMVKDGETAYKVIFMEER
jgi:cell division protein FtsB